MNYRRPLIYIQCKAWCFEGSVGASLCGHLTWKIYQASLYQQPLKIISAGPTVIQFFLSPAEVNTSFSSPHPICQSIDTENISVVVLLKWLGTLLGSTGKLSSLFSEKYHLTQSNKGYSAQKQRFRDSDECLHSGLFSTINIYYKIRNVCI